MSLVTLGELTALVPAGIPPEKLQVVLDRTEAAITEKIGAEYSAGLELTEEKRGGCLNIFTKRPISSITSVTEYSTLTDTTGTALTSQVTYWAWNNKGQIQRLGASEFGQRVVVVYTPKDQRDKRKQAIIDLVRLEVSRTAFDRERVANEYDYEAPESWDGEKQKILRRLTLDRF